MYMENAITIENHKKTYNLCTQVCFLVNRIRGHMHVPPFEMGWFDINVNKYVA